MIKIKHTGFTLLLMVFLLSSVMSCSNKQQNTTVAESSPESPNLSNIETQNNGFGDFLQPEQAFQFSANKLDDHTLRLSWNIADGYHIYKNKFKFSGDQLDENSLKVSLPPAHKADGKIEWYEHNVEAIVSIPADNVHSDAQLKVRYQGCADKGLCYAPMTQMVSISDAKIL